ncbi:IS200/IS605 family accessory protein TnpB-related protein [Cyanobacterium aponinum]|uniref:IS200/IS605 family accessory protein TnpB-related protein n=1 Tax=Cyanobacterium aponinum TaxID=379064 RepID=UPI001F495670|nr:IS200/IS605 family accessory protein TnpB-related protein [Cyanobacterium aponinum]
MSKNLYNLSTYRYRQHFFQTGQKLSFNDLYHQVSKTSAYYALPNTKVAKQIIRRIDQSWKGYFQAHKDWSRVDNYLHTVSRRVIDWCLLNSIGTLVIGKNDHWKQSINIGKKNNQQFVSIPHARLIEMLCYKGELMGIKVVVTEESYTSQSSFLDFDTLPSYGEKKPKFSGKRIKRGLYKTSTGKLINADVNGSYNCIRKHLQQEKVKSNAFHSHDLMALPFMPVTYDPLRTHNLNFLQIV